MVGGGEEATEFRYNTFYTIRARTKVLAGARAPVHD